MIWSRMCLSHHVSDDSKWTWGHMAYYYICTNYSPNDAGSSENKTADVNWLWLHMRTLAFGIHFVWEPLIVERRSWLSSFTSPSLRILLRLGERFLFITTSLFLFPEQLIALISAAKEHDVEFIYAISPGLDVTFSNPKEVAALKRKLDQVGLCMQRWRVEHKR